LEEELMKTLEGMAHELFQKFALKETGKHASWAHLNDNRKLEWMKEVMVMANYFIKEFKTQIKPLTLASPNRPATSYESGIHQGQISERSNFYRIIETTHEALLNELEEFKAKLKK
jgi:hypothetical protein